MEIEKSKSEQKREADALKTIGIELVKLNLETLNELLPDGELKSAIIAAKAISSHGALKRQLKFIGKLMRAVDSADIITKLENINADNKAQSAKFHLLEKWRDKLINEGGEALTAFINEYQIKDIQQLRHLIKKATDENILGQTTTHKKALFKYIRENI